MGNIDYFILEKLRGFQPQTTNISTINYETEVSQTNERVGFIINKESGLQVKGKDKIQEMRFTFWGETFVQTNTDNTHTYPSANDDKGLMVERYSLNSWKVDEYKSWCECWGFAAQSMSLQNSTVTQESAGTTEFQAQL